MSGGFCRLPGGFADTVGLGIIIPKSDMPNSPGTTFSLIKTVRIVSYILYDERSLYNKYCKF
jgi:hypothetical protein